jgi:hypothetical protein
VKQFKICVKLVEFKLAEAIKINRITVWKPLLTWEKGLMMLSFLRV